MSKLPGADGATWDEQTPRPEASIEQEQVAQEVQWRDERLRARNAALGAGYKGGDLAEIIADLNRRLLDTGTESTIPAAQIIPEGSSVEPVAQNPYWLIERGSPAEWWVGNHRISNADGGEWTSDASKAAHFTEWGAKSHAKELESWGIKGPLRATEHVDCDGPPPAQLLLDQCAPYLKEGETPAQCIARNRKDVYGALELLKRARAAPVESIEQDARVWVPREATEKMLERGVDAMLNAQREGQKSHERRLAIGYRAMIAALQEKD